MNIPVKTQRWVWGLVCVVLAMPVLPSPGAAQQPRVQQQNVIWQIGEFDQTSREFGRNFEFESDKFKPVFVVGQSNAAEWPALQVSSMQGVGGKHSPPYTIHFRLPAASKENYKLKIAVLLVNPAVPDLMVEINGHRGRYYFDRKISYYPGDDRIDSPIYGGDELEIDLPGRFFKAGDNSLVLTAVQDSDNPGVSSSLLYDALRLSASTDQKLQGSATIKPTLSVDEAWPKQNTPQFGDSPTALNKVLLRHEKEMIESALAESRGRVSGPRGAAAKLRIPTRTLDSTITRLGINKFRSEKPQAN